MLSEAISRMRKENSENQIKETMEKTLGDLAKSGRIVDVDRIKDMNDELKSRVLTVKGVLNAEHPTANKLVTYVLHKDSIPGAVKQARELYDKSNNDGEIQILVNMGVESYLSPDQLKAFQDLEQRALFEQLPVIKRLWRALFGNNKLKPEEKAKIRNELVKKTTAAKLKIQTAEARREQKKLVSERLGQQKPQDGQAAGEGSEGALAGGSRAAAPAPDGGEGAAGRELTHEEKQEAVKKNEEAEATLKKICDILDSAWKEGVLPSRTYLLERMKEFDESGLIQFLKKHARKEIYSFRVKHDKPEYVWPILISKHYIKRNGRALLNKAIKETDKQRSASMPNQEKFDINLAIEDFLSKLMSKNR